MMQSANEAILRWEICLNPGGALVDFLTSSFHNLQALQISGEV